MPLLTICLGLALAGPPVVLFIIRRLGGDPLSLAGRASLWMICVAVLWLGGQSDAQGLSRMGIHPPDLRTIPIAIAAFIVVLFCRQLAQRLHAGGGAEQTRMFHQITEFSTSYRVFLVITAGIIEEILYRGYGIGLGEMIVGNIWPAATISVLCFTAAHFRWGLNHLAMVFAAAVVLSATFMLTRDLIACILAHGAIDAVGLLLVPAMMAHQKSP